jgi:uncharacterized protein
MVLPDVNVLVYAHRSDSVHHAPCRAWLEGVLAADDAYGMSELVLNGFIRVVTHPKVFNPPSTLEALPRSRRARQPGGGRLPGGAGD